MKNALQSLGLIVTGLLITSCFAWFYVKNKGFERPIHPLAHPFFDAHPTPSLVAYRGGARERPENTFAAFDLAAGLGPDVVLWADVRVTRDGTMVLFHDQDLRRMTGREGWIGFLADQDVARLDPGDGFTDAAGGHPYRGVGLRVPTLREALVRYPLHRFLLNFVEYAPGLDERVVELVTELNAGDRILFQSDIDGLGKDLRERKPMWLYGPSAPQVTRFLMMNSIGLAASAALRADVYVAPPPQGRAPPLDDSSLAELKRRRMRVIAGPVRNEAEARSLVERGVDAVVADAPSEFRFLLR